MVLSMGRGPSALRSFRWLSADLPAFSPELLGVFLGAWRVALLLEELGELGHRLGVLLPVLVINDVHPQVRPKGFPRLLVPPVAVAQSVIGQRFQVFIRRLGNDVLELSHGL